MDGIRLATPEEVEQIKAESDLGPGCTVLALGTTNPILSVLRQVYEHDPIFYNGASPSKKAMYAWGVENCLRFQGVPFYYFNIPASEEFADYRKLVTETWGAQQVSKEPELRYKKAL